MNRKVLLILVSIIATILLSGNVYAYDNGREVFVRHIDKESGQIIDGLQNSNQEVVDISGNSSLVSNSTADDASISYSEYYNYNVSDTMKITKTLVMQVDGKKYEYLGYNKCTSPDLYTAYDIQEQKKALVRAGTASLDQPYDRNQANTTYQTISSNNNDVTIIDFYYSKKDADNIKPQLYCNTSVWTGNESGIRSNVTYIPAGEMLRPYFETPRYFVKDLSYEKTIEGGKVKYKLNKFVVYRIEEAYLKSSESKHIGDSGQIEITGELVGDGPASAIEGINNKSTILVQNKAQLTDELNYLVNNFNNKENNKFPGRNEIDQSNGDDSSSKDFDADLVVKARTYNGLRSAKGNVVYREYNVLDGNYGASIEYESKNDHFINVYTPVFLEKPQITTSSNTSIDHTSLNSSTVILADDATFEIKLSCKDADFMYYNNISPERKARFVSYYYLIFDFDVIHNGVQYEKGTVIQMTNQALYNADGATYFHGQVAPNETLSRDNSEHKIIVFASADNMRDNALLNYVADQEVAIQIKKEKDPSERKYLDDSGNNKSNFLTDIEHSKNNTDAQYTGWATLYGDGYYFAMDSVTVRTVSKLYDFKITDCTDLAFKSAFRDSNTNELQGINYYSGIRRLFVYTNANKEVTTLFDRNNIKIPGTSATTTLPLGPYKHLSSTYISAPKLGYRIAFDVKTTGYYEPTGNDSSSRKIGIKPTYYYVSKDGSTIEKDITLYYKDQSGKYKKFVGSDYSIYFKPNDGYRYKSNSSTADTSYLSSKEEELKIGKEEFFLTDNMVTLDDSGYIQSWYGEFKLPNTTVAVKNGDNVDKHLKDGYIGVKFEIICYDQKLGQNIYYDSENKAASPKTNTTQWDYEGYLGFSNPGQSVNENSSLRIQLEKGIWSISNQSLYDFVKGTVLLYDIDARAADDIN